MLYLDDLFLSIQGESSDAGLPCIFIRLFGCPIGCSYCDQPQCRKNRRSITVERLINKITKYKWCKNVCITGGEPLIQEETIPLAMELLHMGFKVSIETSGCVPIEDPGYRRSYRYIMDVKGPSSGVMHKNVYENLLHLQFNDEVKYLVKDREDYEFMKKVMKKYPTSASILVGPVYSPDGNMFIGSEIVNWLLEDKLNIRVDIQLHKVLNVN